MVYSSDFQEIFDKKVSPIVALIKDFLRFVVVFLDKTCWHFGFAPRFSLSDGFLIGRAFELFIVRSVSLLNALHRIIALFQPHDACISNSSDAFYSTGLAPFEEVKYATYGTMAEIFSSNRWR